jgi:hypothetical protein
MEKLLSLIIGIIGAIIGAGASIITMYLQNKAQNKRDKMKLVAQLGLEDFKLSFELAKSLGRPFEMVPVAGFVHFHSKMLEALEAGELNEEKIKEIIESNKRVIEVIKAAKKDYELK